MPKIKIIPVQGSSYYCSERLSVGVYVINNDVILIDSGIENDTAKGIDAALKAMNPQLTVAAIINTHSHADHCGGNQYFQKKYPALKIYSTKYERHFIEDPINEPRCFCHGAEPLSGLRNKFLEALPSTVTDVIAPYQDQVIDIKGAKFSIMTLPGHTPGMIGVVTPDKVLYTGDAIYGVGTLNKHGVLFYTHIQDTLDSFKKLAACKAEKVVFYHGGLLLDDLPMVVKLHEKCILETRDKILDIIAEAPVSVSVLTQKVIQQFHVHATEVQHFSLTQACVQAYVSDLEKNKKITMSMVDGMSLATAAAGAVNRARPSEEAPRLAPPALSI